MAKLIQLINLNEIKALRITCEKCPEYWPVFVSSGNDKFPEKSDNCEHVIPKPHIEYIKELLQKIDSIQKHLKGFQISIELEIEGK